MVKRLLDILLVFLMLVLIPGCTQKTNAPAAATLEVVCNPPYIRVGHDCCLDSDSNSICDTDEETETTVTSIPVTTIRQTTSVSTTPTSVVPVCGNRIVETGEDCEDGITCQQTHLGSGAIYLDCNLNDCLCYPDCDHFCYEQGVDGYTWIQNILTEEDCKNEMDVKMSQLPADCTTRCRTYSWFAEKNGVSCCCVDVNSLPCQNCLDQNPICPSTEDCIVTL